MVRIRSPLGAVVLVEGAILLGYVSVSGIHGVLSSGPVAALMLLIVAGHMAGRPRPRLCFLARDRRRLAPPNQEHLGCMPTRQPKVENPSRQPRTRKRCDACFPAATADRAVGLPTLLRRGRWKIRHHPDPSDSSWPSTARDPTGDRLSPSLLRLKHMWWGTSRRSDRCLYAPLLREWTASPSGIESIDGEAAAQRPSAPIPGRGSLTHLRGVCRRSTNSSRRGQDSGIRRTHAFALADVSRCKVHPCGAASLGRRRFAGASDLGAK